MKNRANNSHSKVFYSWHDYQIMCILLDSLCYETTWTWRGLWNEIGREEKNGNLFKVNYTCNHLIWITLHIGQSTFYFSQLVTQFWFRFQSFQVAIYLLDTDRELARVQAPMATCCEREREKSSPERGSSSHPFCSKSSWIKIFKSHTFLY